MVERLLLNCEIYRWVSDEPQPGVVEARFTDAAGKRWTLVDKSTIFTSERIDRGSSYPRLGVVRCEVLGRRSTSCGVIVRVRAIDSPRNEGDIDEFQVDGGQLSSPELPSG